MFRFSFTIVLFIAFFAQTFSKTIMVADYFIYNQTYLQNCENKANPVLKCKGKCQLSKKIKQEEKQEQNNPERKMENKNEVLSSKSFFSSTASVINLELCLKKIAFYQSSTLASVSFDFFHPPQA